MSVYLLVAFLFIAKIAVLAQAQPPTCQEGSCATGFICRFVAPCATCQLQARCVPREDIPDDIDTGCQSQVYSQAILIETPGNNSAYTSLDCSPGCPIGAVCVFGNTSQGSCCRAISNQTPPAQKQGICPTGGNSNCSDVQCVSDFNCPDNLKCCPSCGNRCAIPVNNQIFCDIVCPPGQVCVLKTPVCPPGRACIQALMPTCVPIGCANCKSNETCINTFGRYQCAPTNPRNVDQCGGCPIGQVCRNTGFRYQCVPTNPRNVDQCGGCRIGQVCRNTGFRYQCVPTNPRNVDRCGGCQIGQVCRNTGFRDQCVPTNPRNIDQCGGCPIGQACRNTGFRYQCEMSISVGDAQ